MLCGAEQVDHRRNYRAAVSWTDFNVGRLLQELERLQIANDTMIVMHGDHGWHLGEHGMWCKQVLKRPSASGSKRSAALTSRALDLRLWVCHAAAFSAGHI